MLDEIVHGVLKKGYLTKKGHKRKNMRKRWFVLQRNIMKYFDSREGMSLKVSTSNRVICGEPYQINLLLLGQPGDEIG
jgi:hypothetical protein